MVQPDMKHAIGQFIKSIQGLDLTLAESLGALQKTVSAGEDQLQAFIENKLEPVEQDGKAIYRFRHQAGNDTGGIQPLIGSYRSFFFARRDLERTRASCQNLPRIFFMTLAGEYDNYFGTLIKSSLCSLPEPAPTPEECPARGEIGKSATPDKASLEAMDNEVHRLARKSYIDQLRWLENKFGVDLTADLAASAALIEVMERKNSYVHDEGIVSDRYLDVCKQHNVMVENIKIGDHFEISREYFCAAYDLLYEAAIKLGHLLWRISIPEQAAKANAALQDLTFGLIQERRYTLARKLLAFANGPLRQFADENNRFVFLLNGALAAYLVNEKSECSRMLRSEDWDARADILKLANSVLTEQFEDAAGLMRKIGKDNRPSRAEYLRWPLFEEFRKTPEFSSAFTDVFGDVTLAEAEVRPLHKSAAT
jgi:hypothetical protein